jgi:excisionase family DNA binding protein
METSGNHLGDPGLIRLKAAAALLGISVRTLYRIIAEKKLPVVHVRSCSCIEESDLRDYIKKNKGGGACD